MKEFELIAKLTANLAGGDSVVVGPGDDCAVLDLGIPGRQILFKTDAVVFGRHFDGDASPECVGHKALARCLSDIAAMGGTPRHAVVTLGVPDSFDEEYALGIYRGLNAIAVEFGVSIVGGETTRNGDRLLVNVAMIGEVAKGRAVLRSGAIEGDAIFVSGTLGGSLAGRHLEFTPRLREAGWLTEAFEVHSMIDLSDGLAGDLRHVIHASGVGAELLESAIPISRAAKERSRDGHSSKPPLLAALTDGEDYELLFTVSPKDAVKVLDGWKTHFPDAGIACIGRITREPGLHLRDERRRRELNAGGFDHFQSN
jgi:thiamine-monophosphate kinase